MIYVELGDIRNNTSGELLFIAPQHVASVRYVSDARGHGTLIELSSGRTHLVQDDRDDVVAEIERALVDEISTIR
jgi:uncharacterized protein YlzI (FlbEa/FlbD family)